MRCALATGLIVFSGILGSACGSSVVPSATATRSQVTTTTNSLCANRLTKYSIQSCPQYARPVAIPNVEGMTVTDAESAIQQAFAQTGDSGSGPGVVLIPTICEVSNVVPDEWTITDQFGNAGTDDSRLTGIFGLST